MHRSLPAALALILVWTACDDAPVGPTVDPTVEAAAATITAADVADRVGVMAHDSMAGRQTPSPGLEATASYIAAELQAMGIQPAGTDGYMQRFPFTYTVRDEADVLLERPGGGALEHGADYLMLASRPERGDTVGRIVWGGPASTPNAPVDAGLSLAGRVVLYDLPISRLDLDALITAGEASSAVYQAGGVAVGFVTGPDFTEEDMATAVARTHRYGRWIPQFYVREAPADSLLAAAGSDLATLRADGPTVLDDSLRVRGLLDEVTATPPNVVGVLPGSDPAESDEHVVVTAHFDHVGVGLPDATGDSVRNGADDNASGTAAVLELAEALASLETAPARSVLFLLVSGEEWGLLGSAHFAHQPTVPMSDIVANVNLDMIGRNDPGAVIGVGLTYTSMGAAADSLADRIDGLGLDVIPDPVPEERLFFRSDQLVFACREVPALFFTSGLHEDYHSLTDEVQKLDTDKVARVARLGLHLVHGVADAPDVPTWTNAGQVALSQNSWCP